METAVNDSAETCFRLTFDQKVEEEEDAKPPCGLLQLLLPHARCLTQRKQRTHKAIRYNKKIDAAAAYIAFVSLPPRKQGRAGGQRTPD